MPRPTRAELKRRRITLLPPDRDRVEGPRDGIRLDGRRLSMKLGRRLVGARREPGMDATTVSFDVFDDDGTVLGSGLLGRRVLDHTATVTVDGLDYVVNGITQGDSAVTVQAEPANVRRLKRHGRDKPVRASRNDITAAGFCAGLIRDAGEQVLVLDEDVAQPIAGRKKLSRELNKARRDVRRDRDSGKQRVSGISGSGLTVKGARPSQRQRRVIGGVIAECRRLGASTQVTVCAVCCVIQESTAGATTQTTGNDDAGLFQQGRNWIDLDDVDDPALTTRAFLTGAINGGGAPGWKDIHGSLRQVPGGIEAATKRVQVSVGGYQQWAEEARKWVDAGGGGGTDGAAWIKQYVFERKRGESTWACSRRILVEERGWACFDREGVIVIASEPALARADASLTLDERSPLVGRPTFDWHSGMEVGEATVPVVLGRYRADPGEVADVAGLPQLRSAGGWLIASAPVDFLQPDAPVEIQLRLPRDPKPEPSSEVGQRDGTSGDTAGGGSRLEEAAKRISAQQLPYVWGGGHGKAGTPTGGGYDCSGAVSANLAIAGVGMDRNDQALTSGAFMSFGEPGRGKEATIYANAEHVFLQGNGWRLDTSPQGGDDNTDRGARYRRNERSTAGFVARHVRGH